jgi:hypothetical protein
MSKTHVYWDGRRKASSGYRTLYAGPNWDVPGSPWGEHLSDNIIIALDIADQFLKKPRWSAANLAHSEPLCEQRESASGMMTTSIYEPKLISRFICLRTSFARNPFDPYLKQTPSSLVLEARGKEIEIY